LTPVKLETPVTGGLPWATLVMSLLCIMVRLMFQLLEPLQRRVVLESMGASPRELASLLASGQWLGWAGTTPVSSLFLHSSWLHLLGNLAYLWVFGWAVERRIGPWLLAFVFIAGGVIAHLVLAIQLPHLDVPVIGASGAVSAVVGAYLGLFPTRQMGLYLPLGLVVEFVRVPALLVIGSWFALQLVYASPGPITGVMAFWTHLAGFTLGLIFALLVRALGAVRPGFYKVDE
jgi:membrane associated rhomboid family serine protease